MSKMGKWLLISGLVALAGAIAFGVTVAVFGVRNNDYSVNLNGIDLPFVNINTFGTGGANMTSSQIIFGNNHDYTVYPFEKGKTYTADLPAEGITDIRIELSSCKAEVICSNSEQVKISYKTGNKPLKFTAEAADGLLEIAEHMSVTLFSLGSIQSSELTVELPSGMYEALDLNLASGSIKADGLSLDKLNANLASGSFDLSLYAQDIKVNTASGRAEITNSTDKAADSIDVNVASGSVTLTGFGADNTKAKLASGKITLDGISGNVKGELMSGTLTLIYSEWNDSLGISIASGKADVTLPQSSGVNVNAEHLSGKTEIDLDGRTATLTKTSTSSFGGENIHNVDIDAASGSVKIHN